MWVIAMFDLPTGEKSEIKAYSAFRKELLEAGFVMVQFSVYAKHFPTFEKAQAFVNYIGKETPENGKTSFFFLTDKQYGLTKSYFGSKKDKDGVPKRQEQLLLFE